MIVNIALKKFTFPALSSALSILDNSIHSPLNIRVDDRANKADSVPIALVKNAKGDLCHDSCSALIDAAIKRAGAKWPANVVYEKPFLKIAKPKKKRKKKEVNPVDNEKNSTES